MKTLLKIRWSQDSLLQGLLNHNVQWALQSVDIYALKQMLSRQRHCTEICLVFCCQIIEVQLKCYAAYASNIIRFFLFVVNIETFPFLKSADMKGSYTVRCSADIIEDIYMLSAVSLCHQLVLGGGQLFDVCVCVCVCVCHTFTFLNET